MSPGGANGGPSDLSRLRKIRKTSGVMEDRRKIEITDEWTKEDKRKGQIVKAVVDQTDHILDENPTE